MTSLYWSCPDGTAETLVMALRATGSVRVDWNRRSWPHVVSINDPEDELVAHTIAMITCGQLVSGTLVERDLSTGELWIVGEWWGCFLVEEKLLRTLDLPTGHRLEPAHADGRHFLVVSQLSEPPRPSPDASRYDAPNFSGQAVSSDVVLANPSGYYGDYADEMVGGANALFAAGQEAARARGLGAGLVIRGEPEDFGFVRDGSELSVSAWRRKRVIDAEAVGFSLGDKGAACTLAVRYRITDGLSELLDQAGPWRASGCRYGIAMVLTGFADPPVVIPMGAVYQQPEMGAQIQNLAIAQSVTKMVPVGASVLVVLPAYCLNQSFAPPTGPIVPTSLVYAAAAGTQAGVWSGIASRYGRRR